MGGEGKGRRAEEICRTNVKLHASYTRLDFVSTSRQSIAYTGVPLTCVVDPSFATYKVGIV